ncbi:MAG: hypothetical protein MUF42_04850 [Cytophagaceae bacterium]|nr:hypothetical protein [Cytophagaceae bacterium]
MFIVSVILGVALAFILPVKYKAESTFYPLSSQAYDPRYLFSGDPVSLYAGNDDADRIHGIAESAEIKWYVINKYDLGTRYKLDKEDKLFSYYVIEKFTENYSVTETDFNALRISVLDANPDTAAIIVNDIVRVVDSLNRQPLLDACLPMLEKYQVDIIKTMATQDSLYERLLRAGSNLDLEAITMEKMRTKYEYQGVLTRMACLRKPFSTLNVIERGSAPKKRSSPVRWLVVVLVVAGSIAVYTSVIIFMDQSKGKINV